MTWLGRFGLRSMLGFSRETEPTACMQAIYYDELAHIITEAEKPHDLLSMSWRLRKADGIIQSESKGPRMRGANGVHPSLRAGEILR